MFAVKLFLPVGALNYLWCQVPMYYMETPGASWTQEYEKYQHGD